MFVPVHEVTMLQVGDTEQHPRYESVFARKVNES